MSTFVVDTVGWSLNVVILCVGLQNRLRRREDWSYRFNYPAVFTVKHQIYIPNAAGSDFLPSAT